MHKNELLELAGRYFIADSGLGEANLIRKIQVAEGHADCFATGRRACAEQGCRWRGDCLGTLPGEKAEVPAGTSARHP